MNWLSLFIYTKPNQHLNSSSPGLNKHYLSLMKPVCRLILWILVLVNIIPFYANSQTNLDAPKLSIQTQSYLHNPDNGTYLYRNAKVEWEGITVESTEIIYHPGNHILTAWGYVRVTE